MCRPQERRSGDDDKAKPKSQPPVTLGLLTTRSNKEAVTRMPQGQCTLPADEAGRILDRLAGLEQVIRTEEIQQALDGHRPGQFASLYVDSRSRLVGGAGDGIVDRLADPTGLQTRPAAAQGRRVAPSLQPLRRTSAVGRGAGAATVRPGRSPPGPARHTGGVLPAACG